ncbi:MAG TPA: NUDIX hydrolase [Bradyrhizobium sp.]|uniref:NUDIX hydrolase n=1 Tax=Bradyrhizobium sp. TaxID=376 RepID=UPI002D80A8BB|nr:NUDIX hydrolase [Bradyrhizobium sp.]HET7889670.1 NUDIX hydrolase [Bradyrhizobium sp.]
MARSPVLAAGGIVLRASKPPQIAVVRLRKGEWVLPKGKLDDGETPREAAIREVWEETGHDVSVHEFLGTLAYDAGGRSKIVHYWRMETQGKPTRDLMRDVIAVDWLPLQAAVERLSRDHERAFLANVGPLALESAALARRSRETKALAPAKPRRRVATPKSAPAISPPMAPLPQDLAIAAPEVIERSAPLPDDEAIDAFASLLTREIAPSSVQTERADVDPFETVRDDAIVQDELVKRPQSPRVNMMQRVRGWLRRVG